MAAKTPRRPGPAGRRMLLALGALVVALLLGEIACRVKAHVDNQKSIHVAFDNKRPLEGRRVAMIDVLQMSPNDKIIFELKPGMQDVPFKGAPLTTNRHGFRGPDYAVEAEPGTITIVGLGDSVMFGYGVPNGSDYLSMLETRLRQRHPQKRWRCINTAVPAYNTVMEVETLRTKGLAFGPDLVILGVVVNDLVLPPYIRVVDDVFDLRRSFLFERLARGTRWVTEIEHGFALEEGRDRRLIAHSGFKDESLIPERFRPLVGWEPFAQSLRELDALSESHGFEVVSFTTSEDELVVRMIEAAREQGWLHVRLFPEIQKYLWENHGGSFSFEDPAVYMQSKLAVAPSDGHPSVLQHFMAANKLFDELERNGVIARLLARD